MQILRDAAPLTGLCCARHKAQFRCWFFLRAVRSYQPYWHRPLKPSGCRRTIEAVCLGSTGALIPPLRGQVAEAQSGMTPRPPMLDHDALADTIVEHKTVYHFYAKSAWTLVKLPD